MFHNAFDALKTNNYNASCFINFNYILKTEAYIPQACFKHVWTEAQKQKKVEYFTTPDWTILQLNWLTGDRCCRKSVSKGAA